MAQIVILEKEYLQQYRSLMLHAYKNETAAFTSTAEERESLPESWWLNRLNPAAGQFLTIGAVESNQLVGAVGLEFNNRTKTCHKARLVGMYVHPKYRGVGIAEQLLNAAIGKARDKTTVHVLVLSVTAGNTQAEQLYLSAGFELFGNEPMAIYTSR